MDIKIVTAKSIAVGLAPLALAFGIAAPVCAGASDETGFLVAQLFRQRVVVRVQTAVIETPRLKWREKKGPRCLPMAQVSAAAVIEPSSVDFVLRGGQRLRARFAKSCPGLAYYSGFYVAPNADGQMCAGRDVVRDRAGGECEIARLRLLVPRAVK